MCACVCLADKALGDVHSENMAGDAENKTLLVQVQAQVQLPWAPQIRSTRGQAERDAAAVGEVAAGGDG